MRLITFNLLVVSFAVTIFTGCSSGSQNPAEPSGNANDMFMPFIASNPSESDRTFLGSWTAVFDLDSMALNVAADREAGGHWNLKTLLPAPYFQIRSFDPVLGIMDVDATISNPYQLDGYDLRLIVYTDNAGNRLLNPDAWISLFDITGGAQANPFKAYAKDIPNRMFARSTQHTERLQLYFPSGVPSVNFAIDASYPGNCGEPYKIANFTQTELYDEVDAESQVSIEVYDWQNDVGSVMLYCPAVTGVSIFFFQEINATTWGGTIKNKHGISTGQYNGYIAASSGTGTTPLYYPMTIMVDHISRQGWVRTWGSAESDSATNMSIDNEDNMLVSGYFRETIDLDPGLDVLEFDCITGSDTSLSKFNPEGSLIWGNAWQAYCPDINSQVAVDSSDNPFISSEQISVRKYNSGGTTQWTESMPDLNLNLALEIGNSEKLYMSGNYSGEADFDPGLSEYILTSYNNTNDAFINVLDNNGNYNWTVTFRSLNSAYASGLAFSDFDSFYVVGEFTGTTDFDSSANNVWKHSTGYIIVLPDAYLAKYSTSGAYQNVLVWGGENLEPPSDVAIGNDNQIHVYGKFSQGADFDPDPATTNYLYSPDGYDLYLSVFNSNDVYLETIQIGGVGNENSTGMFIDSDDNIYLTGSFDETTDLDPGPESDMHTSVGSTDIFVIKLDSQHDFLWARTFGSTGEDKALDIAVDSNGNIYVAGYFNGTIDFYPGPIEEYHSTNGFKDCFLLKLLPDGNW